MQNALELVALDVKHRRCLCRCLLVRMSRSTGDFGYGSISGTEFGDRRPLVADPRANPTFSSSYKQLADAVSGNIFTIGANVSSLEQALKQIGTNKDTSQMRSRLHDIETSTNAIVNHTTNDLRQLSTLTTQMPDNRAYKLQWQRLTGEFKEVTQRYSTVQKQVAEKVKLFTPASSTVPTGDLLGWNEDNDSHEQREERQRQLMMQDETIDIEVALLQEREAQIRQLEADILDVNQIFRDLGMLIHEQGEVVDTIEAHVTVAHDHVEEGREQLLKAAAYQVRARKKKCCLFVILFVVVAVIIAVIVLSVKLSK